MQQLIEQLTAKSGINEEQATGILGTIKEYAAAKFPALGNSIDWLFSDHHDSSEQTNGNTEKSRYTDA
jgi:hypothetical protein